MRIYVNVLNQRYNKRVTVLVASKKRKWFCLFFLFFILKQKNLNDQTKNKNVQKSLFVQFFRKINGTCACALVFGFDLFYF